VSFFRWGFWVGFLLPTLVQGDASLLGAVTAVWREHAFASPLNNYIVRRRAATPGGVLLTYPGSSSAPQVDIYQFSDSQRHTNLVINLSATTRQVLKSYD
jgi:hypothetical protein